MYAVRPYLHSTCMCAYKNAYSQAGRVDSSKHSRIIFFRYHTRPLSSWDHKMFRLWLSTGAFWWCVWHTLHLWGTLVLFYLFILFLFLSVFFFFFFFPFLVSPEIEILNVYVLLLDLFLIVLFLHILLSFESSSCNWSICFVHLLVSCCCIWKLFWDYSHIKFTNERVFSSFVTFESILFLAPDFGYVPTGEST